MCIRCGECFKVCPNNVLHVMGFEKVGHVLACSGAGLAQYKGHAFKIAGLDRILASHRMVRRRDEHVGMHRKRVGLGRDISRRPAHDREIDLGIAQQRDELIAVGVNAKLDLDSRVLLVETCEQPRQEVLGRTDETHAQLTGLGALQARHHVVRFLQYRERALGVEHAVFAGACQRHLAALAIEQRQPDLGFEIADLHRDGRGCHVQLFRGPDKAVLLGDRDQRS